MSVMYCVNEYTNMIKADGKIEKEELKNILKLDTFLADKYKNEKSLNEIVDKIYKKIDKEIIKPSLEKRCKERLKLYNQGLDDDEIAVIQNCTTATIGQWRIRQRLLKHQDRRRNYLVELHEKRLELYHKRLTDKEIAKELNLETKTIKAWRGKQKLKMNKK